MKSSDPDIRKAALAIYTAGRRDRFHTSPRSRRKAHTWGQEDDPSSYAKGIESSRRPRPANGRRHDRATAVEDGLKANLARRSPPIARFTSSAGGGPAARSRSTPRGILSAGGTVQSAVDDVMGRAASSLPAGEFGSLTAFAGGAVDLGQIGRGDDPSRATSSRPSRPRRFRGRGGSTRRQIGQALAGRGSTRPASSDISSRSRHSRADPVAIKDAPLRLRRRRPGSASRTSAPARTMSCRSDLHDGKHFTARWPGFAAIDWGRPPMSPA